VNESEHERARLSLGSYLVGALDAADRRDIDRHLASCAACRDELVSYAGLPGLMARLDVHEVGAAPIGAPPGLLNRTLESLTAQRRDDATRLRRWRTATFSAAGVAAGATAAAVFAWFALSPANTSPSGVPVPLPAAGASSTTGQISYLSRPWGTQVHLVLSGLPRQGTFTAWAIDENGAPSAAATWSATPDRRADVTGATALARRVLTAVRITTSDGTLLLSARA